MDNLKLPPHSKEAEKSVVGSMILSQDAIATASEILKPEDFYGSDNKEVFNAIMDLYNSNTPVDPVTLSQRLRERGTIETLGGAEYISNLMVSVPTTFNVGYYAKIVEEKAILRRLIESSKKTLEICYDEKINVEEVLEATEKNIFDIAQKRVNRDFESMKEILIRNFEKLEELQNNGGSVTGVPTGFVDFDRMTSGLQPSDLILIAARPSMGKTAFALNIASYAGIKKSVQTAVFSLEMSKEQLVNRILCSEAMVESQNMRTGALTQEEWRKIIKTIPIISDSPIYIDDTPSISIVELRAKCRRLKLEKGLGLIIIDYLQLMSGGKGSSESRQQEISEISRSLKAIAREMEAPVIALSQLSRAPEQRADHRPMLSDLRESGAIEQDADLVIFLYRDEYYNQDTDKKNIAEAIIAKQRNGPVGTVELTYMGQFTKFGSITNM